MSSSRTVIDFAVSFAVVTGNCSMMSTAGIVEVIVSIWKAIKVAMGGVFEIVEKGGGASINLSFLSESVDKTASVPQVAL